MRNRDELEEEIRAGLNRVSAESASNTPDWILAQYLLACLDAFNMAVQQRESWYGRDPRPCAPPDIECAPSSPEFDDNPGKGGA